CDGPGRRVGWVNASDCDHRSVSREAAMAENAEPLVTMELVERLAGKASVYGSTEASRARIFPGTMPPGLSVEVPLPPDARLLGSSLTRSPPSYREAGRGVPPEPDDAEIYLDVPADAAGVFAFFEAALRERGWTPPPEPPGMARGGF